MDADTKSLVDKILAQNDKIIDAIACAKDEKAFEVLAMMLDNSGAVLDALFPQVQYIATASMEDEPPMMQ